VTGVTHLREAFYLLVLEFAQTLGFAERKSEMIDERGQARSAKPVIDIDH
jgi:hypothetical protein